MIPASKSKSGKVEVPRSRIQGSQLLNVKRANQKKREIPVEVAGVGVETASLLLKNAIKAESPNNISKVVEHSVDLCPSCGGPLPKGKKYCSIPCYQKSRKK